MDYTVINWKHLGSKSSELLQLGKMVSHNTPNARYRSCCALGTVESIFSVDPKQKGSVLVKATESGPFCRLCHCKAFAGHRAWWPDIWARGLRSTPGDLEKHNWEGGNPCCSDEYSLPCCPWGRRLGPPEGTKVQGCWKPLYKKAYNLHIT
jgi:hypothetical protein